MRCLALNASFEPLTMVPLRRALRLVIDGKAEIVEAEAGEQIRSPSLALPKPAISRTAAAAAAHAPIRWNLMFVHLSSDGFSPQAG